MLILLFAFVCTSLAADIEILKPSEGALIYSTDLTFGVKVQDCNGCKLKIEISGSTVYHDVPQQNPLFLVLNRVPASQYELGFSLDINNLVITKKRAFQTVELPELWGVEAAPDEIIEDVLDDHLLEDITQKAISMYSETEKLDWISTLSAKKVSKKYCSSASGGEVCRADRDGFYTFTGRIPKNDLFTFRVKVEWSGNEEFGVYLFGAGRTATLSSIPLAVLNSSPLDLEDFITENTCRAEEPQIESDLRQWTENDLKISQETLRSLNNDGLYWAARVQIIDNAIFFTQPLQHRNDPYRQWFFEALIQTLLHLSKKVRLPNVDFLAGGEVPQCLRGAARPLFSMTKSDAHEDILMPDLFFQYWDGSIPVSHPFYRPPLLSNSDGASNLSKWKTRVPKLWWKGTVGGWKMNARGQLVRLARHHPDLMEVKALRVTGGGVTEAEQLRNPLERMEITQELLRGTPVPHGEMENHKYLANTHGNGNDWSNRFRALLSTESVVFKQESSLYEFWEDGIAPYVHYVPIARNYSDLVEKIEWAKENDEMARQIAIAGARYVRERLRVADVHCYWARLLWSYSKLLDFDPVPVDGATEIQSLL